MIETYLKLGFRNLKRNKLSSITNLIGLSLSFACCTVIFLFIGYSRSLDSFHENYDEIYLLTHFPSKESGQEYGIVPSMLPKVLKSRHPQIDNFTRIELKSGFVRVGEKEINDLISFCDKEYFEMFSFPLIKGKTYNLKPYEIVISKAISKRYFGEIEAVGQEMNIEINNISRSYIVAGIIETYPDKSSFRCEILLPYEDLARYGEKLDNWNFFSSATFVQIGDPIELNRILQASKDEVELYNLKNADYPITNWSYEPLKTLSINTYKIKRDISRGFGSPSGAIAMIVIGLVLLILSSLNFVNTSLSIAIKRISEMGLRKVFGSSKKDFLIQFCIENIIIILFSFIVSLFISYFFLVPGFNSLFSVGLGFNLFELNFWLYFMAISFLTTLFSSFYPSLYISKFQPNTIFAGKQKFGSKNLFLKTLITLQITLALVFIVIGFLFLKNEKYQESRDLGYRYDDLLIINVTNNSKRELLLEKLKESTFVRSIARTGNYIGGNQEEIIATINGQKKRVKEYRVGLGYLEQLDVRLIDGRYFKDELDYNQKNALVNEAMLNLINQEESATTIRLGGYSYNVIGIVKDIYEDISTEYVYPTIYTLSKNEEAKYLSISFDDGMDKKIYQQAENYWKNIEENGVLNAFYHEEIFQSYLTWISGHRKVMIFIAIFTVVLSSIGLFSLLSLKMSSSIKAFSVMKILGIEDLTLFKEITKNIRFIVALSILIGIPFSLYCSKMLFSIVYKNYTPISILYPIVASFIIGFIATLVVIYHYNKLQKQNPLDHVRSE